MPHLRARYNYDDLIAITDLAADAGPGQDSVLGNLKNGCLSRQRREIEPPSKTTSKFCIFASRAASEG